MLYSAGYIAAGNVSEGTLVQRGESNKRKDSKERVSLSLAKILEEFQSATDMARKTSAESDASPISKLFAGTL